MHHPNCVQNKFDDGFVVKDNTDNVDADWIVRYPVSNKDAQTVGVDLGNECNVPGTGYKCNSANTADAALSTICDCFVANFNKKHGSIDWDFEFDDLDTTTWLVYNEMDDILCVTGISSRKRLFLEL